MSHAEWMISVDDHVIEPPNLWTDRLPSRQRDAGPRWVVDDDGESWIFDGRRIPNDAMSSNGAIYPPENRNEMFRPLAWSEIPEACYDPAARIRAMDEDCELAALVFPNMPGFAGSLFQQATDKDIALQCIRAWNDWFLEEWVGPYPGRFISMAMIPMWDGLLAAAEAERAIANGARSVSFSQAPHNLGFAPIDSADWDPLYSVLNDANLPICTHLGTGMAPAEEARSKDWRDKMRESMKNNDLDTLAEEMQARDPRLARRRKLRPGTSTSLIGARMGQDTLQTWLDSDVFDRFPNLKLVLSENGVGWIPPTLALADWIETLHRTADEEATNRPMPSERFRQHVFGCFIDEPITPKLLEEVGAENIMIESDFPHTATNWPNSMARIELCMAEIDSGDRRKILRENAERVFNFTPAEPATLFA